RRGLRRRDRLAATTAGAQQEGAGEHGLGAGAEATAGDIDHRANPPLAHATTSAGRRTPTAPGADAARCDRPPCLPRAPTLGVAACEICREFSTRVVVGTHRRRPAKPRWRHGFSRFQRVARWTSSAPLLTPSLSFRR